MMEREEFLTIKNRLTDVVLEYETLQRKIHFLHDSYIIAFKEILEQRLYLEYENKDMTDAIAKKENGASVEEVETFLENCRNQFALVLTGFQNKVKKAQELEQRCRHYRAEDIENLDREFMEFCTLYHPVIKAHSTIAERNAYSAISMVYRMGNIPGFKNLINEFKDVFTTSSVLEEEYDTVAKLYEESYKNLVPIIARQKNEFPLNIEPIFSNEAALTNEYADLREKTALLRDMNKQIHKDFLLYFEFDFQL